tara:strand:+ start:2882 stop:3052 length:171 start_codon:yes stop_codon:yes gene_type:complete
MVGNCVAIYYSNIEEADFKRKANDIDNQYHYYSMVNLAVNGLTPPYLCDFMEYLNV